MHGRHRGVPGRLCFIHPAEEFQRIGLTASGRGELPRPQECARRQRVLTDARGSFRQTELPRNVLRIEVRAAFVTKQRVLRAIQDYELIGGPRVLFDGLFRPVLLLQKKTIARNALRWLLLLGRRGLQKTIVDGERFGLVARLNEQIKERPVIHGGAFGLAEPGVQIAEGLRCQPLLRRAVPMLVEPAVIEVLHTEPV